MRSSMAGLPSRRGSWSLRRDRLSKLPVISGKELVKVLTKHFGFRVLRQRGSHVTLTNDSSFITVPMHHELDPGTLRAILNDARVTREHFLRFV